jgi:hypothetical protein
MTSDDSNTDSVLPVVPNLNKIIGGSNVLLKRIETSFLHEFCKDLQPTNLEIFELNTTVLLPSDPLESKKILHGFKEVEYDLFLSGKVHKALPSIQNFSPHLVETCLNEFTQDLVYENIYHKPQIMRDIAQLMNNHILTHEERRFKEEAISDMSQKLALLAVEHIKEQSISKESLSRCQISDDYLSLIHESVSSPNNEFPAFHITKGVLFKRKYDRDLKEYRSVIALPDLLLPSVIHSLHKLLSHPSFSTTLKNFETYYYHRRAKKYVKEYVRSCVTCVLAGKIDVRKIESG